MSQNIYNSPKSDLSGYSTDSTSLTMKEILFSFKGRIGRSTYWLTMLGMIGAMIAFMVIAGVLGLSEGVIGGLFVIAYVPLIWISFAVQAKRWHDRNKSGWWILISFIPVIGAIWAFIENGCLAGTDGENNYGPPNN